mmetsp:Transcript_118425/g.166480  ORF Transcript_118425/g.166480 Transcript_118425/m.166480 type:complete len:175 (+) Transcript_118425:119-643(+)
METRNGFIRKVYSILTCQMIITCLMCAISMTNTSYLLFQLNNPGLFYFSIFLSIAILCAMSCSQELSRTVPTNYILLTLFTVCESYMISMLTGLAPASLVFTAAFLTMGMFFALTLYACTTKKDFTMMGGMLFVVCMVMFLAGILLMFTNNDTMHIIYDVFGVLLFSVYIIYDT